MKKQAFNILAVFAVLAVILISADSGNAQKRREARGKRYTKAQVENVIDRVEERVDNFVRSYNKSLDKSRLDGTRREDWLLQRAENLENATDELRREFDRRDNWFENKNEVRKCLNIAAEIDRNLKNRRYGRNTENIWARVRFELNTLADIYNLPKAGSGAF